MMSDKKIAMIDGIPVQIEGEKNLLELIRKAGIELPTFCYYSELSVYGACRLCVFEDERGNIDAACSAQPWSGMIVKTNTERLRTYRKMILELLLATHCGECTACEDNGTCKLQEFATRFHIENIRFPKNTQKLDVDTSSPCITKDQSKCILCGDCVRMCSEIQNVGAIDFAYRSSKTTISTAFNEPLAESNCVGCGQCVVVCPTGAIMIRNETNKLWKELDDPNNKVIVQIAPAVRVAIGESLGVKEGEDVMGKITAALRRLGFAEVFDTSTGADLTVLEEAAEFAQRLESGKNLPLMTSCCPAWVQYCEDNFPEMMSHVSSCRSPMQMMGSILKEYNKDSDKRTVNVAVMPCTAKKYEAARDEFKKDGVPDIDYVITTRELIQMIRESGIVFSELDPETVDVAFGTMTGAGVIFGVTGGVTEAVLRHVSPDKSRTGLRLTALSGARGMDGVKETSVMLGEREVKIAIVSGLKNAYEIMERVKQGEKYDFIEVMACPGGCVNGAGQPVTTGNRKQVRAQGLYMADNASNIRLAEQNPLMTELYGGILKGREHELLHVHYDGKKHD